MKNDRMDFLEAVKKIKKEKPLIHHITNTVTMQDCANITAAMGGAPVMACYPKEVEEVTAFANALVLNTGTPSPERFEAIFLAGKKANQLEIPVVLDPVGAGVSHFRREGLQQFFKQVHPDIIKGNAAEIKTLSGLALTKNKGVDSEEKEEEALWISARKLAREQKCVVVMTGKIDFITDGQKEEFLDRGSAYLTRISGSGCMTASLIGCFCSVCKNPFLAGMYGVLAMDLAGEEAEKKLQKEEGAGTFKMHLFDKIEKMAEKNQTDLERRNQI